MSRQDDDNPLNEAPDDSEMDQDIGDEFTETVPCPYCKKPVYEQAEVCPHCRRNISQEDAPTRIPAWIVITALVVLTAFLFWLFY